MPGRRFRPEGRVEMSALSSAVEGPLGSYREIEINPVMLTPRGALVVDALLIS